MWREWSFLGSSASYCIVYSSFGVWAAMSPPARPPPHTQTMDGGPNSPGNDRDRALAGCGIAEQSGCNRRHAGRQGGFEIRLGVSHSSDTWGMTV